MAKDTRLDNLENILKRYFRCPKPFKGVIRLHYDPDSGLTERGKAAVERLSCLLCDLENAGILSDGASGSAIAAMENILDNLVKPDTRFE